MKESINIFGMTFTTESILSAAEYVALRGLQFWPSQVIKVHERVHPNWINERMFLLRYNDKNKWWVPEYQINNISQDTKFTLVDGVYS